MHHRFARSVENIAIVSESVAKEPNVLNPRRSQESNLPYGKLWRILHLVLHLHPCKVRPADHSQRRIYLEWVLEQQAVDGNFRTKFSSAIKHFSYSVGMLINKIVVLGVLRIPK